MIHAFWVAEKGQSAEERGVFRIQRKTHHLGCWIFYRCRRYVDTECFFTTATTATTASATTSATTTTTWLPINMTFSFAIHNYATVESNLLNHSFLRLCFGSGSNVFDDDRSTSLIDQKWVVERTSFLA